ncbi:CBS domain-containing protein [Cardiosporidium cionae]|uniref:CBS domain-containing protein n=1 Tax=Cardiosporidium cionae TaxID=476202 RepID=A0ABQ7JA01_9APIC|nr:CBS domain-containing protein [Cardiosporidium cionae]|eukprot:KAF8820820.1 CBS domain-containing protein [Cardiosporidium cionae]
MRALRPVLLEESFAGSTIWWVYLSICISLILFSGLTSGLTTGLMSFDEMQLLVLQETGDSKQKKSARQVFKLVQKHHLLLVTLLLSNSAAMEALPIFLDRLVPSWLAIVLSVTFIFIFGEVVPQALCTGPNQLKLASAMVPFVQFLIFIFMFLAWPISKILDCLFGTSDSHYYARHDLKALIGLHQKEGILTEDVYKNIEEMEENNEKNLKRLGAKEVIIIQGALDMAEKNIRDLMVPIDDVFMMEFHTELTPEIMKLIFNSGHSRIPIYEGERNNIKGVLLTKSLILVHSSEGYKLSTFLSNERNHWSSMPVFTAPSTNPYVLLNEFSQGKSHLAFVTDYVEDYQRSWEKCKIVSTKATLLGIVTLEDVIEELIQSDITDEFDRSDRPSSLAIYLGVLSFRFTGECSLTTANNSKFHLKSLRNKEKIFAGWRLSSFTDNDDTPYSYKSYYREPPLQPTGLKEKNKLSKNMSPSTWFARSYTAQDERISSSLATGPLLDDAQPLESHESQRIDVPSYVSREDIQREIKRSKSSRMWPAGAFNIRSYKNKYHSGSPDALRSLLTYDPAISDTCMHTIEKEMTFPRAEDNLNIPTSTDTVT